MLVIFPVYDRIKLLPYFLRYYESIGATHFVCALFDGKRNPLYPKISAFQRKYKLDVRISVDSRVSEYNPLAEKIGLNIIRKEFSKKFRWYCIADLDEFHYFGGGTLHDIVQKAEKLKFRAVGGVFVDRIAADGFFPAIHGSLDKTFPLGCDLTHCCESNNRKISLARSTVQIEFGHHEAKCKVAWGGSETHHFKWHNSVRKAIAHRYKLYSKQNISWAATKLPAQLGIINRGVNLTFPGLHVRKASILGV